MSDNLHVILNIPKAVESGLPDIKTEYKVTDGRSGVDVKVTYTDETIMGLLASFTISVSKLGDNSVLVHQLKVGAGMADAFQTMAPQIVSRLEDVAVKATHTLIVDLGDFEIESVGDLKLYIWKGVLADYTPGVIFAMAYTLPQARKVVMDATAEDWARESVASAVMENDPEVHETPYGFYIRGGG